MLDEHLADGVVGEVGVDGLAAERCEGVEVFAEGGVAGVLAFKDGGDAASEVGDFLGELEDGIFPVDFVGLSMLEEELKDLNEGFGLVDGSIEGLRLP